MNRWRVALEEKGSARTVSSADDALAASPLLVDRSAFRDLPAPTAALPPAVTRPTLTLLALTLLAFTLLDLALPPAVEAQEPRGQWLADVRYERDLFEGSAAPWSDWQAVRTSVYREMQAGTVGLSVASHRRFGRTDQSVVVDAYRDLWSGSYANLRVRVVPGAEVLPFSDWWAEVFQTFAGPWEASAHLWLINAAGPDVTLGGGGLARYAGLWYLRARGSVISVGGEEIGAFSLSARRFVGGPRQFVQASAGLGGEVITVGPGPDLESRDTRFVQITGQRYLWELGTDDEGDRGPAGGGQGSPGPAWRVGIQVTGGLHDFEGIPLRRRLSVGVVASF